LWRLPLGGEEFSRCYHCWPDHVIWHWINDFLLVSMHMNYFWQDMTILGLKHTELALHWNPDKSNHISPQQHGMCATTLLAEPQTQERSANREYLSSQLSIIWLYRSKTKQEKLNNVVYGGMWIDPTAACEMDTNIETLHLSIEVAMVEDVGKYRRFHWNHN
jgi:hypothetical protein